MQELTLVPFLAQPSQPVLAYQVVERVGHLMFVGTRVAQRTVALTESFAVRTARVEAKPVLLLQKVRKGKGIRRGGM